MIKAMEALFFLSAFSIIKYVPFTYHCSAKNHGAGSEAERQEKKELRRRLQALGEPTSGAYTLV